MRAVLSDSWKRLRATEPGVRVTPTGAARARRKWSSGKVLKIVRRIHLYTGLIMLPWIFLFGISGMLFNHPTVGQELKSHPLPPPVLQELTGIQPWQPEVVASQVINALNGESTEGSRYRLDPSYESEFTGVALLNAPAAEGRHFLLLDVQRGRGVLNTRVARARPEAVPFDGRRVPLEGYSMQAIEQRTQGLLPAHQLESVDGLRAHPKIAPVLRFRVRDEAETAYNVTYHVGTGELSGRRASEWSPVGLPQLLSMLHTTHHYAATIGPLWFWALFEDLLGLTMAFWAISGVFMWWQMKPTRIVGVASLLVALGIAGAVMWTTTEYLMFGDVPEELGPGG